MSGLHAADGSLNVTVVTGSTYTGLYAPDGSLNVVLATAGTYVGAYHPCGAWYVTLVTNEAVGRYALNGSLNVVESPFSATGAVRVFAVSGDLTPGGGGGGAAGTPMGLLLALTYAS